MNRKVDASLYWSVQRKKKELMNENEELKRELQSFKFKLNYINPKDSILINNKEYRLDLSDGKFYTKQSFQDIYGLKHSELWEKSGILLQSIINELNKYS